MLLAACELTAAGPPIGDMVGYCRKPVRKAGLAGEDSDASADAANAAAIDDDDDDDDPPDVASMADVLKGEPGGPDIVTVS